MDALWGILPFLFFIVVFVIIPRMQAQRQYEELIRQFTHIQRKRKSRLIAIVHRQEPMGLLGIPNLQYIDLNDSEDVLEAIRRTPADMPLELVLHTPGGLVMPALQIARAIKAHRGPTTVYVPHYAMSGGTLIALAADKIIMSEHAALGPIDPQIGGVPAASVLRLTQSKDINSTDDYTLILADVGEMALRQLQAAAFELLQGTVSDNAAQAVAEQLSSGRWTHDYPIIAAHAEELGLNVSTGMPEDIMKLMRLFPSRLSGQSVKSVDPEPEGASARLGRFFGRRKTALPPPRPAIPAPSVSPVSTFGAPPKPMPALGRAHPVDTGPGERQFRYGPWVEAPRGGDGGKTETDRSTWRRRPSPDGARRV